MTRRTVQQLVAQAQASLPDNTTKMIDPSDVRNMVIDFLDTVTPMYGGLHIDSKIVTLSATPVVITYQTVISSFPPEWVCDAGTGVISRSLGAVPAVTSKIIIGGVCEGPQGREIAVTLYRNNVATGWATEETLAGPGKSTGFGFISIDYSTTNVEYKLMANFVSGATTDVTFRMMTFVGENIPVREIPTQLEGSILT